MVFCPGNESVPASPSLSAADGCCSTSSAAAASICHRCWSPGFPPPPPSHPTGMQTEAQSPEDQLSFPVVRINSQYQRQRHFGGNRTVSLLSNVLNYWEVFCVESLQLQKRVKKRGTEQINHEVQNKRMRAGCFLIKLQVEFSFIEAVKCKHTLGGFLCSSGSSWFEFRPSV